MTAVLITGADGYVGRLVVAQYLRETDDPILAAVHASSPLELAHKATLLNHAFPSPRLRIVPLDLTRDDPCASLARHRCGIGRIIHAAAITHFDVSREAANRTNVRGTRALAEFAHRCPLLTALCHVSTIYASGLQPGPMSESSAAGGAGFANHYEWSKWAAEEALDAAPSDLPVRIARLATVIAHDQTGAVVQHNAFHQTLRLYFHGLLSIMPGERDVPLYFVTGEVAARCLYGLSQSPVATGIYHISHTFGDAITLGSLADIAYDEFSQSAEFRRRRVLPLILANREIFDLLRDGLDTTGAAVAAQALHAIAAFAPQLFVHKRIDNLRLRGEGLQADSNIHSIVRSTCRSLAATRWGRRDAA